MGVFLTIGIFVIFFLGAYSSLLSVSFYLGSAILILISLSSSFTSFLGGSISFGFIGLGLLAGSGDIITSGSRTG